MGGEGEQEVLRRLEECTRDARSLQLDTLRSILDRNAGVVYLRPHLLPFCPGHGGIVVDAESFRRLVPLSSYEDYATHVQRIADGYDDPSVLSSDPLLCFFYSSGTSTMKPKMIPFFDSKPARVASSLAHQASSALLRRLFPPRPTINKIMWFLYAGNVTETRAGIKVMAASAFPFQNKGPNPMVSLCVSPPQVLLSSETQQQMYCHLLCGLRNSHLIDGIRAPYAAGLVRAFRLLESRWEQLCEDIEFGSVNSEITDSTMRDAVEELFGGPQPDIAKRIREICGKGKWGGILSELWPDVRYIACVTTGTMEQYYPVLKYYAGKSIPLLGGEYFASECPIGLNLNRMLPPEQTSFVILPTAAYFEFLPFEFGSDITEKETVDLTDVEVGKVYEVVATTYRGLYRYRLGDVVRVVGFYNSSPRVEFVTRVPKDASEVFTERDLMSVMESFRLVLGDEQRGEVVEYAGYLDLESAPKHVIIFMEMMEGWVFPKERSEELHEKYWSSLEACLGSVYKVKRASGDLGPLEIAVVNPGSFEELVKVALENGAPANQYKPPKILRNRNIVDVLKASTILTIN